MLVIPYNSFKHASYMKDLLESRGMEVALVNDLPQFGLIALDGNRAVATGFVRALEGNFGVLDSFITNAKSKAVKRDRALNTITRKLIDIAKINKVRSLMAFTTDFNTARRASSLGFSSEPHKFFILNTKE